MTNIRLFPGLNWVHKQFFMTSVWKPNNTVLVIMPSKIFVIALAQLASGTNLNYYGRRPNVLYISFLSDTSLAKIWLIRARGGLPGGMENTTLCHEKFECHSLCREMQSISWRMQHIHLQGDGEGVLCWKWRLPRVWDRPSSGLQAGNQWCHRGWVLQNCFGDTFLLLIRHFSE